MDEFELIRRYFPQESGGGVLLGIGDDGAVVSPGGGKELAVVADTLVAGVHYPASLAPEAIGWRAVAVNASDLAAMGARPLWFTLALTLEAAEEDWLAGFSRGLFEAAREYGATLVGGDTTKGPVTVATVNLIGSVGERGAIRRDGAAPGEQVWVTGTVGDAAGGLSIMQGEAPNASGEPAVLHGRVPDAAGRAERDFLVARFARPAARVGFGEAIAGTATAAIDLSDGLGADLQKLLTASGVAAVVEADSLPVSAALQQVFGDARARELALTGGDDYELCFTAPPAAEDRLRVLAEEHGLGLTAIGRTEAGAGLELAARDGRRPWHGSGYSHF